MSLTTKQKIIKSLTPICLPIVKLCWRIFKPKTQGVKVIVGYKNKFLFVRHTYGSGRWNLPGGKIDKGEDPKTAALREAKEEVGLDLANAKLIDTILSTIEGKRDNIHIFFAQSDTNQTIRDEFEIEEIGWFSKNNAPTEMGFAAQRIWNMFVSKNLN